MIPRYSNEKISSLWTDKNRYEIWRQIEIYICEKLCIDKKIPKKDFLLIKNKSKIDVNDIQRLDKKTHHEVIAFLNSISKKVGKSSRYIHQGVTSSDIIDTAFSVQLKQSTEIIINDLKNLLKVLKIKAKKYKGQIDLLVGGSPCQSFSMVGKRKGLKDTRGTLFYEFARIVKESQPKVFIFENVKGLINHDKGNTFETIKASTQLRKLHEFTYSHFDHGCYQRFEC